MKEATVLDFYIDGRGWLLSIEEVYYTLSPAAIP